MACRLWLEKEIGIDLSLLFLPYAIHYQRFGFGRGSLLQRSFTLCSRRRQQRAPRETYECKVTGYA